MGLEIKIGEFILNKYLDFGEYLDRNKLEEITSLYSKANASTEPLNIETETNKELTKQQLHGKYPLINLEFLQEHTTIAHRNKKNKLDVIQLPRFAVQEILKKVNSKFSILMRAKHKEIGVKLESIDKLPIVLEEQLSKTFEFSTAPNEMGCIEPSALSAYDPNYFSGRIFNMPNRKIGKQICRNYHLKPTNQFTYQNDVLLPPKTKNKLMQGIEYFKTKVYLVSEIERECWNQTVKGKKPAIIIGIFEDKCYLIDHFLPVEINAYKKKPDSKNQ